MADGADLIFAANPAMMIGRSDISRGGFCAAAIQWIGGQHYRPRYKALVDASSGVLLDQTRTLGGMSFMRPENGAIRLSREVAQTQRSDVGSGRQTNGLGRALERDSPVLMGHKSGRQ